MEVVPYQAGVDEDGVVGLVGRPRESERGHGPASGRMCALADKPPCSAWHSLS